MSTLNQIKVEDTLYDIEDKEARNELLNKVNKVEGKGLSTNDFTDADKEKLDSLSNSNNELFMVNITIEGTQYVADKTYNEVLQAYNEGKIVQCTIEVDRTKMVLPLCNINEENSYLVYGGAAEIMTIAVIHNNNGYIHLVTQMLATQEGLANKQDNLISGQNIKTINGEDILGVGNIEIQGGTGGSTGYKLLNNLTLTEETRVFTFTQDLEGKPFECDEILILLTTVPMANATEKCSIQYNISDSRSGNTITTNNSVWIGTTKITNSCHIIKPYSSSNIRISAIRMGEAQSGINFGNYDGRMTENSYINKIQVYIPPSHNHSFGIGTDIEIYGR